MGSVRVRSLGPRLWHWLRFGAELACLPCSSPSQQPGDRGACPQESLRDVPPGVSSWGGRGFSPHLADIVRPCLWHLWPCVALPQQPAIRPGGTPAASWAHLSHHRGVGPPRPACPSLLETLPGGCRVGAGCLLTQVFELRRPSEMRGVGPGWWRGFPPYSPQQPWKGTVLGGAVAGPALSLHSWGCPKQKYTFNESSSEINW